MRLTAITCTGNRPQAFALCERYMARQTLRPDQWIVVDDGDEPAACTMGQTIIRRARQADDPAHTLIPNLQAALPHADGDALCFIEDDDWYHPTYIAHTAKRLARWELVGEGRHFYYRIQTREWMIHNNNDHAALCGTAFRRNALWAFERCMEMAGHPWVDLMLWKTARGYSSNVRFPDWDWLVAGIKGMPGRRGMGLGHEPHRFDVWAPDRQLSRLRATIGNEDAELYLPFVREAVPA